MEEDNKLLHMLTSSVTHEMMTPLKCMIEFSKTSQSKFKKNNKEAKLITTTCKLMLAQVQLLLDKNKLEHHFFQADLEMHRLNNTI